MLSPSQKSILTNRSKLDGSTASSQYVHIARKAIKLKIMEACEDLKLIAESDDEQLANMVNACLAWHIVARDPGWKSKNSKNVKKVDPVDVSSWPTAEELENAAPFVPDPDEAAQAFKDLRL